MEVIGRFVGITSLGTLSIATYHGQKDFTVDLEEAKKQTKDINRNEIISIEYKNKHTFVIQRSKIPCPRCKSDKTQFFSYRITGNNEMKKLYKCKPCHKEFTI